MLKERIKAVQNALPPGVTLVAASKTMPAEVLNEAKACGLTLFGENRVQELVEKYPLVPGVRWHFIGHLQTNKVKQVVDKAELIHSVDSVHLAIEIDRQAEKIGKVQEVLLEINVAEEPTKSGFALAEADGALLEIARLPNVRVVGLMGMVPLAENVENNVKYYLQMKEKYDTIKREGAFPFRYLSMGMSNDYETAVRCGANMVRIGTAIFGKRAYT